MAVKTYPIFGGGGGGGGGGSLSFPLVAPNPGSAGQEPFRFATGGGLHGDSSGGVYLSVAAGDAVAVDAQANVSLPEKLTVQKLTMLLGGVRSPDANFGALTVTGDASLGGNLGVGGSAQITGDLTARKITASSDLSAANVSTPGRISGTALTITGSANIQSLAVTGTFKVSGLENEGAYYFPESDASTPGVALGSEHGTGLFATPGSLGLTVAGQPVLNFGQNRRADFAGALTATDATFFGALSAATIATSGDAAFQAVTGTTLTFSGAGDVGQSLRVRGDLTVDGMARLANLRIDELSTDHDLSVGEDATIVGNLTCQGSTTLQGSLSVGGPAAFGAVSGQRFDLATIFQLGGDDNHPAVLKVPVPNQPTTTDYSFVLGAGGYLSMSADLLVGGTARLRGATTLDAALSGTSASFSGAVSSATSLSASRSTIGGSTFQTCHGPPAGQLTGSVGDLAVDIDSGSLYLKLSGSQTNSGWVIVTTQATASTFPLLAGDSPDTSHPQFAFSGESRSGLGRLSSGALFLAVAGQPALQIAAAGGVSLAGALAVGGAATFGDQLSVSGATSLAGLTAGTTQLGALTAGTTSLGATTAASATVQGSLAAQDTSLASLSVQGAAAVTGALASALRVGAPLVLVGQAQLSSGSGQPNGSVTGSVGDGWLQTDAGDLWLKTQGQATNTGWAKVSTSATGTTFPLQAPLSANLSSPSYGFQGAQMGLTDQGANVLVAVTSGAVGWTLDAAQKFTVAGVLAVPGTSNLGAVSANTIGTGSLSATAITTGTLTASGQIRAQSLATTTGAITSADAITAAGQVTGSLVASNGSVWRASSSAPSNSLGSQGDLASVQAGSGSPLVVRTAAAWRQVALVGDPVPTAFPLLAPSDSAAAPSYSTSQSPNTGMYFPGPNRISWSTNGVSAGGVDANQNWSFVGAVSGGAATFTSLTVNGPSSLTGDTAIGGSLQVAKAATFAAGITAASGSFSGAVTAGSGAFSGALSAQSATTSGDVAVGGNLTVSGTTTYAGIQRTGYIQTSDGSVTAPAVSFTAETGLGSWRPAAGTYAIAVGGANALTLTGSLLTVAGAVRVGGTNAGLTAPGTNSLALQTAGTAALTFSSTQAAAFASTVTAPVASATSVAYGLGSSGSGLYGFSGSGKINPAISQGGNTVAAFTRGAAANNYPFWSITIGDATDSTTNTTASQGFIYGSSTPPNGQVTGTAGSLYCHWATGSTTPALYINESPAGTPSATAWQKVVTTSTTITPTFPLVGPAGSPSAPTFAVGSSNTGIYSGSDTYSTPFIGIAQGAKPVAFLQSFTSNSATVSALNLGDPSGTANIGGFKASTIAPAGNIGGGPGQIYQYLGGGADNSIFVYEGTSPGTGGWAKVLTSSSSVSVTFPLKAPVSSAAAPSYGFGGTSGYASTGMFAAQEAANSIPVVAFASNSSAVGYFQAQTLNSQPMNNLFFGSVSSPSGGIRVSPQSPVNTIGGLQGQLYLNTAGSIGTSLWIKEFFNSSNGTLGWASVLTSGMTQIATQQGSVAAPFYSFNGATNTGLAFVNDQGFGTGSSTGLVTQGRVVAYVSAGSANSIAINSLVLGDPSIVSSPYPAVIRGSAQAASGNLVGAIGQVAINTAGGAGTVLAVKESSTGTTAGWSLVLTEGSAPRYFSITTGAQVSNVSGRVLIWADTSNQLRAGSFVNSTSTPIIKQEIAATQYGATQTIAVVNNNTTIVSSAATQYTLTLPASSSTIDLCYRFQVENASGVVIKANTGQLIYYGASVSSSAGTLTSTTVGSTVELFCRAGTNNWYSRGPAGTWQTA